MEDALIKDKDLLNICWKLRASSKIIDKNIIISTRGIITLEKLIGKNKVDKTYEVKDLFKVKFFENVSGDKISKIIDGCYSSDDKNIY